MKDNPIAEKSFNFAKRIYFFYKFLKEEKKEYIISKHYSVFHTPAYHSGFQAPAWKPNL